MEQPYYLWHCQRAGWISKTAGTTTEIKDAQQFDRAVAVQRAKAQRDHMGAFIIIPVSEADIL